MARGPRNDARGELAAMTAAVRASSPAALARRSHKVWKLLERVPPDEALVTALAEAVLAADALAPMARLAAILAGGEGAPWFFEAARSSRGGTPEEQSAKEAFHAVLDALGREPRRAIRLLAALLEGEPGPRWMARMCETAAELGQARWDALAEAFRGPRFSVRGVLAWEICSRVGEAAQALSRSAATLREQAERIEAEARGGDPHPRVALGLVRSIALAPAELAVPELQRLAVKVRHKVIRKAVDRALEEVADAAGTTRGELEDAAVPTHGLDAEGRLGSQLALDASGRVVWEGAGPKRAEARSQKKELERTLSVQRARLERAMVDERAWPATAWRRSFVEHPLLASLGRRLLWLARGPSLRALAFVRGAGLEDLAGRELELAPEATIGLAHPLHLSPDELDAAREGVVARRIVQPWKQVFREIYVPTAAERVEVPCDRFRNEVVPQHQLYALTRGCGWSGFACIADGTFEGTRRFAQGCSAWLGVDLAMDGRGIRLGSLLFLTKEGREWTPLRLGEVPPLVFSEACRDLDLVVGVASVGEDAAWIASEEARREGELDSARLDRSERALGATAASRGSLLERILPALGLGDRVSIDGRFARVRGELNAYRVHLGSAHVHIEPSGRFVVFPRGREAPPVYLPEDAAADPRTAEVVRRILLLAGDALVEDPALRAQLGEG